ncbi:hypothetical protein [Nostoc sp.]|uniref:hypothetical protein n=1 Tax=Nostoc sp. TaxID=1180 RepID=UPI002FF4E3F2
MRYNILQGVGKPLSSQWLGYTGFRPQRQTKVKLRVKSRVDAVSNRPFRYGYTSLSKTKVFKN